MPIQLLKSVDTKPRQVNSQKWNKLVESINKLPGHWQSGEIINIDGWLTTQYKETSGYVFILAELSTKAFCDCEVVGAKLEKHGLTRPMKLLDLPVRGNITEIYYRIRRFRCTGCQRTIQQSVPERHDKLSDHEGQRQINHNMTKRLVEYIKRESLYPFKSFFDICLETGANSYVVRNIFTNHVDHLEKNRIFKTPRFFAMDENFFSSRKNVHCIITSPEDRTVLEVLKDNSRKSITTWLRQLPNPEVVEAVSMDMCPMYIDIIKEKLPKAVIVLDRYHVHNLLNVELKSVLAVLRSTLSTSKHREIMRREKLVLKSRHVLSDTPRRRGLRVLKPEKEDLENWFTSCPILREAYELKESFSDILHLTDRNEAEDLTDHWLERLEEFVSNFQSQYGKQCKRLGKYPFRSTLISIQRYRPLILNYIDFKHKFNIKVTNAFAEFANKQIKKAYTIGNGYQYEVLRVKLIYGGLLKKKLPTHPLDEFAPVKIRKSGKKKSIVPKTENPNANISRLKKVLKDQDKISGGIPPPQENEEFNKRFGASEPLDSAPGMINYGVIYEDEKMPNLHIYEHDVENFSESSKKVKPKKSKSSEAVPPLFEFFNKQKDINAE